MSTTSPARLSYDVFVWDGPAGAGDERMPDGAPLAWSPLSSTLIFGAQDALLVDPPFTRTQIQAVGDWVERSGRRLAYIYATHGHGDHWFGTGELARRFPGVTVYATEGTIEVMRRQAGPKPRAAVRQNLPGPDPGEPSTSRADSRPGIPAGGQPGRGRRDRAHRHRQDHGAAHALHRPGRRR
jgi:glyoxylase-like metal-dependent hydrolase (beta-lactamase superfamily II)